ncbi:MAG TPA: MarR family transcriptional regulator [Bryobacteraceae bacterium]|nr:MarR family transcriptional regulator [Bryobacteraceae bacterium]
MRTRRSKPNAAQLWIVLARCHRAVSTLVERSIAGLGLCLSDFMVLEALLHKGPLTISEIQAKVLLASGSMTAAVDRLEKRSLVIRKTTTADRRARLLELTPEGRLVVERAFKEHSQDLERVMSVLDTDEKEQLYTPLKKLGRVAAEALHGKAAVEKIS